MMTDDVLVQSVGEFGVRLPTEWAAHQDGTPPNN